MRGERQRTDFDVLRDRWVRWTAILSLFALGRPARCRLDPGAYAALRNELIAACRSLAETDGPERAFYESLEEMVKPWLNLRALDRTDREILTGLVLRCREVESKLSGRKWKPALPRQGGPAMAIVAGGAVLSGLGWLLLPTGSLSVLNTVRDAVDTIWFMIKFADDWQKASAFAVIVVVAAIYVVSRSAKV
jgi:hypothetical protein